MTTIESSIYISSNDIKYLVPYKPSVYKSAMAVLEIAVAVLFEKILLFGKSILNM